MKNLKGVLGLLFLISFFWQLFQVIVSPAGPSLGSDAEFAIRTGTSLAVSLVLGVWLLRSSLKVRDSLSKENHEVNK